MKSAALCLLYGIVFARSNDGARGHLPLELPQGVGGAPVKLIEEDGLGAAVSLIEPSDLAPNIERGLAYARVVEALHADRTVLPMRYGCLFTEEPRVVELLRLHREEYAAILRELDGCVEMGVRALVDHQESPNADCGVLVAESFSQTPGTAYLAGRRAVYAEREWRDREDGRVVERCREALTGLFVRWKAESLQSNSPHVALSFLVKREAVESFRVAFRRFSRTERARLLLSGPWPPYNFAAPERSPCRDRSP